MEIVFCPGLDADDIDTLLSAAVVLDKIETLRPGDVMFDSYDQYYVAAKDIADLFRRIGVNHQGRGIRVKTTQVLYAPDEIEVVNGIVKLKQFNHCELKPEEFEWIEARSANAPKPDMSESPERSGNENA
jgi:hypothetical protein